MTYAVYRMSMHLSQGVGIHSKLLNRRFWIIPECVCKACIYMYLWFLPGRKTDPYCRIGLERRCSIMPAP